MYRKRVIVSGGVQGVFFRDTCRATAAAQGVNGWVRNLPDGTVEAVFEGGTGAVEQLVDWARQGPPTARVEHVEVHEERPEGLRTFEVRPTPPAARPAADSPPRPADSPPRPGGP
ncbi:acylphosphatase [Streptomyces sp. HNM0575]|uniref:acylphosphatase n=1 Tax=Streptomyces sp. HNM0575 TaxID=2716338 RepID=UPI00145D4B61|nr:acylphosphatase [Streptomyces sp. HNM0575]NLU74685.1 acylphosphatase [Streptomyces sp. HNM0575]